MGMFSEHFEDAMYEAEQKFGRYIIKKDDEIDRLMAENHSLRNDLSSLQMEYARDLAITLDNLKKIDDQIIRDLNTKISHLYSMLIIYRAMLGENGQKVAQMWEDRKVLSVHFDLSENVTGEKLAKSILEWENSPKKLVEID